MAKTWFSIVSH